jgi:hypothetical protein
MWKLLITSAALLALGATAGCDHPPPGNTVAAVPPPTTAPAQAPAPQLAAAEPFEALTETASTASRAELQTAALKAEAAAAAVRGYLSPQAAGELASHVVEMRAALQKDNRADMAIASVEAYRTLVSAAPRAQVPMEVNLLDYAGFRYQADLRATPIRWADMAQAGTFARSQWATLSPQVTDPSLRSRVQDAMEGLRIAQEQRDPAQADRAARMQLDLVDELEAHFNARPPSV